MIVENVMIWGQLLCELMIDVFNEGWGVVCGLQLIGGFWILDEKCYYINYLELLVVFLGFKVFCILYCDRYISLKIDNIIVVVVINYMGISYFGYLNKLCKEIWDWCIV